MSRLYSIPEQLEFHWHALRADYRSYGDFMLTAPVDMYYATSPFGTAHATETSITLDPAFCAGLKVDEIVGTILHEIFHIILEDVKTMKRWTAEGGVHCPAIRDKSGTVIIPARVLHVDMKIANIGMDCRINDATTRILGAKLPQGACYHPLITFNATAEETYTIVWEEEKGGGGGGGGGKSTQSNLSGKGTPGYQPGDGQSPTKGGCDVSDQGDPAEGTGNPLHNDPSRMRGAARQAIEDSDPTKSRGVGPGELARLANMVQPRRIPWEDEITRDVRALFGKGETDWSRPHKTFMGLGRYWPGQRGNRMGTLVAVGDDSGSMSKIELGLIVGLLQEVVPTVLPERLIVLDTDDRVNRAREFDEPEDFIQALKSLPCKEDREATFIGGGGTDMGVAFQWCKDNNVEPDLILVIGDCGTAWPKDISPAKHCIVACTDPRPEVMDTIPAHMGKRFHIVPQNHSK